MGFEADIRVQISALSSADEASAVAEFVGKLLLGEGGTPGPWGDVVVSLTKIVEYDEDGNEVTP